MSKWAKINFKKLVSWVIGLSSALIMFSEVEDARYWFIPFVAAGVVVAILCWNHVFTSEGSYE